MKITVHRGTHQIGGCITEIKTKQAKIIIDMGAELPSAAKKGNTKLNIEGVTAGTPACDGVFITHYHGDHVGLFEKVLPGVPLYMGQTAKQMFLVLQRTLKKLQDKGRPEFRGNPELVEKFKTFTERKTITINDLKITPYTIDHSAFDAYMFLLEAESKRVLHTGDFRMHGARGSKMPAVLQKYARNIDVLVTEGTMLSRPAEKIMTEHELGRQAKRLLNANKSVFVLCSAMNIDTIAGFYNAAITNKRLFIVCTDDFQLEILRIVTKNSRSPFYDFNRQKIYTYAENLHAMMDRRGFCMLGSANGTMKKALEAFPASLLIYSMWDGYLNKNHAAFNARASEFVEKAVAAGSRCIHLHTSGHAAAEDLKKVCAITQAKIVAPIHCEKPEAFRQLGINSKIQILQDGESLII
jgi:ribonuclease J